MQCLKQKDQLLKIERLSFTYPNKIQPAVDEVSMSLERDLVFGLIGESTCGKTTLGKLITLLLFPSKDSEGYIEFNGEGTCRNIFEYSKKETYEYRKRVQMIFQNPDASLNPGMKVKSSIMEALKSCPKNQVSKDERQRLTKKYLNQVNLVGKEDDYPDSLSGGEKRRVSVVRTLAMEPDLIVADEPFSNLDVSLRNQLIKLFQENKEKSDITYLFILHDLDVARYLCDKIAVMYRGRIIEIGDKQTIFSQDTPKHPYTRMLLSAWQHFEVPQAEVGNEIQTERSEYASTWDNGCAFSSRCVRYDKLNVPEKCKCETVSPLLKEVIGNHQVACHFVS